MIAYLEQQIDTDNKGYSIANVLRKQKISICHGYMKCLKQHIDQCKWKDSLNLIAIIALIEYFRGEIFGNMHVESDIIADSIFIRKKWYLGKIIIHLN